MLPLGKPFPVNMFPGVHVEILAVNGFPMGSFDNERKGCVLFLRPFCGSFFHQGLQWLFLVLFFAVFTFAHDC